jgi:hypothetical protein
VDPDDDAFLIEMAIRASVEPCQVPCADLLFLLLMAGIGPETAAYQEVAAEGEYVLVKRKGF